MRSMSTNTKLLPRVAGSLVLVAVGSLISAQVTFPTSPSTLPSTCPSVDLWQTGTPITAFGSGISRTVRVRPDHARVDIEWRYANPELPTVAIPNNIKSITSETFATGYWPTYVRVLDSYHFCVAGKGRSDSVVVEQWAFANTNAEGNPAPSVLGLRSVQAPQVVYSWTLPPRNQVTEVIRADSSQTGLVRALFRDPGDIQHVFVWYDASRAMCRVDLTSGASVTNALPTPQAGALTVPQLTNAYDSCYSADYQDKGYCYFFSQRTMPVSGSGSVTLVLIDSNRDGLIETSLQVTPGDWVTGGWSDPTKVIATY